MTIFHSEALLANRCRALVWGLVALGAVAQSFATPSFAHIYRVASPTNASLGSSRVVASSNSANAYLLGSLSVEDPDGSFSTAAIARFGESSRPAWSVYLDSGPAADLERLFVLSGNPELVAGTYEAADGVMRIGVTDASNLTPVYCVDVPLYDPSSADITFPRLAPNDSIFVTEVVGNEISVLAINSSGTVLFDKRYQSTEFLGSNPPPEGQQQYADISPATDGSSYLLIEVVGTPSDRFVIVKLDTNGEVLWARKLEGGTLGLGTAPPLFDNAPDGSVLLSQLEIDVDFVSDTLTEKTHLTKIASDGSLVWATTIEDATFHEFAYSSDTSHLYMLGTDSPSSFDGGEPTIPVVMRLNGATGALVNEVRPLWGSLDYMNLTVSGEDVYLDSFDLFLSDRIDLIRLDASLSNPEGFWRTEVAGVPALSAAADSDLFFSEYSGTHNAVQVTSLDHSLTALDGSCPSFAASTVSTVPNGLTQSSRPDPLLSATVTCSTAIRTITPAVLPLAPFTMRVDRCPLGDLPLAELPVLFRLSANGSLSIEFPTKLDLQYELYFTDDPAEPFRYQDSLIGDGGLSTFEIFGLPGPVGLYQVRESDF